MLLLVAILLLTLMLGLLFVGKFNNMEKMTFTALDMQMDVFEKNISQHFLLIFPQSIHLCRNVFHRL